MTLKCLIKTELQDFIHPAAVHSLRILKSCWNECYEWVCSRKMESIISNENKHKDVTCDVNKNKYLKLIHFAFNCWDWWYSLQSRWYSKSPVSLKFKSVLCIYSLVNVKEELNWKIMKYCTNARRLICLKINYCDTSDPPDPGSRAEMPNR